MIETRHLQHFVAVATHGSFARAARTVHLSLSALSRSIQALESGLGLKLIDREKPRIELTNAGAMFLERAKEILCRTSDLEREVSLLRGVGTDTLAVGAGPYPADIFVGEALGRLTRQHPNLRIRFTVDTWLSLRQQVQSRQLELMIGETSELGGDLELEVEPMEQHQGYFVVRASHPLSTQKEVSIERILSYPLALTGRLIPRVMGPMLKDMGIHTSRPLPTIECDYFHSIRAILTHSDAVSMATLSQVEAEVRRGTLVVLPMTAPWLRTNFGFIQVRGRALSPAAAEFKRIAREVNRDIAAREAELLRTLRKAPKKRSRR